MGDGGLGCLATAVEVGSWVYAEDWYLLASLQGGLLRFGAEELAQHS